MKNILRIGFVALAISFCGVAKAQYQVTNGDFETWTYDGNNLPNNWNSFQTADGNLANLGYSSSNRQVKKVPYSSSFPGPNSTTSGNCCVIWARSVWGVIAQGNLTTGRVHAGSMFADNKDNYNYSDRDGSNTNNNVTNPCAMTFTGQPDAVSVWIKFVPAGTVTGYTTARFSAIIHDDNDYIAYGLPSNDDSTNEGYIVAKAAVNLEKTSSFTSAGSGTSTDAADYNKVQRSYTYTNTAQDNGWVNFVVDFDYDSYSNTSAKYILFNTSTNAYPGKGTSGDSLYIDDIVMIYNHDIKTATYDGEEISFTDNVATVNAVYDADMLAITSNGHSATVEKEYDSQTGVLTVNVKGGNYSDDNTSISTYTIKFQISASMSISSSAQYATFVAPFDVTVPSGVTAYTVSGYKDGSATLNMTEVSGTISANTPVILYSKSGLSATNVYGINSATGTSVSSGLLTGVYSDYQTTGGEYVLQNHNGKVAFYKVDASVAQPWIRANRCYIPASASSAKVLNLKDDATAISTLSTLTSGEYESIYSISGAKLNSLQKGVNILKMTDGTTRKVLVK